MIGLIFSLVVLAATSSAASPSASPRAQEILDRVTNQITQIANQLKRTYVGKIKSVGTSSIVLTTPEGDKTISTNDATTFYKVKAGSRTEINFSNLKVGDDLSSTGTIDPQTTQMTARQVISKVHRYNIVGTIGEVNKNLIKVKEFDGPNDQIDLADAGSLKKIVNGKLIKATAADFQSGSIAFIIGYMPSSDATSLSILKAIVYTP